MADRANHYEAAFEAYLRSRRIPYLAVDESRRSLWGGGTLKSLDFVVSPLGSDRSWLVDIKGRNFPSGRQRSYWKNWSTRDDLQSLVAWQRLFGERFGSLLVFAYNVWGDRAPLPEGELFEFRGRRYAFVAIRIEDYARHARGISTAWGTIAMPVPRFRELAAGTSWFFESVAVAG